MRRLAGSCFALSVVFACPAAAAAATPRARAREIADTQRTAGPSFAIRRLAHTLRATNHGQGLAAEFDAGLALRPLAREHRWHVRLDAAAWGCSDSLRPVAAHAPRAVGNRVERGGREFTEWYVHGPLGVEHGFTLAGRPACRGTKVIRVGVAGTLRPQLAGADIELVDADGTAVLGYSHLYVEDARGVALPASFAVIGDQIELRFDDAGASYPVTVDPLAFNLEAQLVNPVDEPAGYGQEVAIHGDRAVVAAPGFSSNNGRVWGYQRENGKWISKGPINPPEGEFDMRFGHALALFSERLVVGTTGSGPGFVATYEPSGPLWALQQKLVAPADNGFGTALAVSGDRMIVSDTKQVFVYRRVNDSWVADGSIFPTEPNTLITGVALDGDLAVLGGPVGDGADPGHAWAFRLTNGAWVLEDELAPSISSDSDNYGDNIAIRGDLVVVGASDSDAFGAKMGAAFVFRKDAGAWKLVGALKDPNGEVWGGFGRDVLIVAGDLVLVGAPESGNGHVYGFTEKDGKWSASVDKYPNKMTGLGVSLATDGTRLIVGETRFNFDGAARIYTMTLAENGDHCSDPSDCKTGFCADGVCCDTACGDSADDCMACSKPQGAAASGVCGPAVAGFACRAAAGPCDVEDACDGVLFDCPADALQPAGVACREASGTCDVQETCPGDQVECPPDGFAPDGTECELGSCAAGVCEGPGPGTWSTTDAPTTGGPVTTGESPTTAPTPTSGESPTTDEPGPATGIPGPLTGGATGSPGDDGCACTSTQAADPRAALAALLLLALGRRRRAGR